MSFIRSKQLAALAQAAAKGHTAQVERLSREYPAMAEALAPLLALARPSEPAAVGRAEAPPPPATPTPGVFHSIGRFFRRLFRGH